MPSLSPGAGNLTKKASSGLKRVLPGAPLAGHQTLTILTFRWKTYILYISGKQLNILKGPVDLTQAITLDEDLVAVEADVSGDGRFALATKSSVWIYKPLISPSGALKWVQELQMQYGRLQGSNRTISWGTEGELLIGSTQELALYSTLPSSNVGSPQISTLETEETELRSPQWVKSVGNAIRFAHFSPSCSLIATAGDTDRLVKIWRRLSFEEAIFDFAYLPHNGIVTHLEWRPTDTEKLAAGVETDTSSSFHGDMVCEVLYTISSDGTLAIWRTGGHYDLDIMTLYTTIDLVSAIPHSPVLTTNGTSQRPARYSFVIPCCAYSDAVDIALKKHSKAKVDHAVEHLKEVQSKDPDIVVLLDAQGRMSAWGLSSIGHKRRPDSGVETDVHPFHVAHSEHMGLTLHANVPTTFKTWFEGDVLNILAHSFDRSITWWRGTIANFSSSAALDVERGEQVAVWSGADAAIDHVRSLHTGSQFLAQISDTKLYRSSVDTDYDQQCTSLAELPSTICDQDSSRLSDCIVAVLESHVVLVDPRTQQIIVSEKHRFDTTMLKIKHLSTHHGDLSERFIIYDGQGEYIVCKLKHSQDSWNTKQSSLVLTAKKRFSTRIDAISSTTFDLVLHPRKSGWIRAVTLCSDRRIYRQDKSCSALEDDSAPMEETVSFSVSSDTSTMSLSTSHVALLSADGKEISIYDLKDGYLEHLRPLAVRAQAVHFPAFSVDDEIRTTHDVLALSFSTSVDILLRSRYHETQHEHRPHWVTIKSVDISSTDLSIRSLAWLDNFELVIAAGNTTFISDGEYEVDMLHKHHRQELEITDGADESIHSLVDISQAPVTCWQPRILMQLVLHGYYTAVVRILLQLQTKLRFYTNGAELDALLDLDVEDVLAGIDRADDDDLDLSELDEQLAVLDLPFTSDVQQDHLRLIAKTVAYVSRHKHSLDINAIRFLMRWRYDILVQHDEQHNTSSLTNGHASVDEHPEKQIPQLGWRDIFFAHHTVSQQPLLDVLLQYYGTKLTWNTISALGVTVWLRSVKAAQSEGASMASVEQIFDALAQNAYRASDPPNPADAALYLLAIRKKAVLLSLWRMAVGNREQKSTMNFLRRDFDVEDNRVAARKNAYALMGKRRFEYAAAFFLLADDPASALSILAGQLDDIRLAVSVARAYCGDESLIFKSFVQERVVPAAKKSSDRWMLSWAYTMLIDTPQALHALSADASVVFEGEQTSVRRWEQDDPVTMIVYQELRDATNAKPNLSAQGEYRAVLRAARILRRMGFWLLALRLVKGWTFIKHEPVKDTTIHEQSEQMVEQPPSMVDEHQNAGLAATAPSMLDGFSATDSTASRPQTDAEERAAKAAALLAKIKAKREAAQQPANGVTTLDAKKPTQFQEPAASSILDSFGF